MSRVFITSICVFFANILVAYIALSEVSEKPIKKSAAEQIRFELEPFSMNKDLDDYLFSIKNEWQAYSIPMMAKHGCAADELCSPTVCRPVEEMAHVYFCGSYKQRHQNYIFARMAVYNEGAFGLPKGTVVDFDNVEESERLEALYEEIAGVDLRGDVVTRFFLAAGDEKLTVSERAFRDNVLKPILDIEGVSPFYIITVSVQNAMAVEKVLSHEALHAQYYIDSESNDGSKGRRLADVIEEYYTEKLTDDERAYVIEQLSVGDVYNVNDPFVLYKEFYSYMLEGRAKRTGRLRDLVRLKGDEFRDYIELETGLTTIRVGVEDKAEETSKKMEL